MSDNIYYDTSSRSHTYDQTVSVRILFLYICHLSNHRSSVGTRRRETTGWRRRRRRRRSRSVRARTNSRARLEVRLRRVDRVYIYRVESRASFNDSFERRRGWMDDVLGDLSRVRLSLSRRVKDASCDATRCVSRRVGRLARRDVVERDAIGRRGTRRAGRIVFGGGAGGDLRERASSERRARGCPVCVVKRAFDRGGIYR